MKWFQGDINEAVAASKSRKAIFVVFVEGKDDASVEIAKVIDSGEISSQLERDEFVAIKLEGGSESYGFFAQIYKLVPVPSLFFIGQNGAPIEVIAGETSIADLMAKIDTILKKVEPALKDSSTSLIQAEQNIASRTISAKPSEAEISTTNLDTAKSVASMAPLPATSKQYQNEEPTDLVTAEPSSAVLTPQKKAHLKRLDTPSQSGSVSEIPKSPELTAEEKLERARQLIELKKQQREEEEARKARESEIERRKTGQELLRLKQKQQDLEIKQAYEERQREKAAEAAAKERVRQQIAQDKIERKQRELNRQQQQSSQPSPVQEQPKPRTPTSSDSGIVRIQFRLPSGTPHMGQFESTVTLGALRAYIVDNIELPFRQFALSTSFPRRELVAADDGKTLLELELVPTAVILILPIRNPNNTAVVTSAQDDGYLSRFMWGIFASIASAFGYIRAYFTGIPPRPTVQQNSGSASSSTASSTDRPISPSAQNNAPPPGLIRRNLGGLGSTTIRAQGNIHRLNSSGDPDNDENNTWNGNSTQQM